MTRSPLVFFRLREDLYAQLLKVSGGNPNGYAHDAVEALLIEGKLPEQAPTVAASTAPAPVPVHMPANIGIAIAKAKAGNPDEPSLQCPKCAFRCVTRAAMTYHYEKAHPELLKASVEASP